MFDETTFFSYVARMANVDPAELTRATRVHEDLGATSQMLFGVSALLEKLTGTKISFADINNCPTLGDVIDLAQK